MSKVLFVTTSHDRFAGDNPHPTGVWLEEFAVPYMELLHNGMEITVASPQGGAVPIDPRSLPTPEQGKAWHMAIEAAKDSEILSKVSVSDWDAIFLPGGHGPMFDLPDNPDLQRLLRDFHQAGKVIAAVCHGVVGLVGVTLPDGTPLVKGKVLTSYTNSEEIAAKLDKEVPFSLEGRLRELGAIFIADRDKADHVERDGKLITGQNPNSSASIARSLVSALSQHLPPIFNDVKEAIAPAKTIAEFPVNTFLENIAIAPDGTIFVTSYEEGKVYRLTPDGEKKDFARIEGNVAGIAIEANGNILIDGALNGKIPTVWRIEQNGNLEAIVTLPDAIFLNGMTHLAGDTYLIADSYKGAIWAVDAAARTVKIWIEDPLLARSDTSNPFPAVNGIKIYGNSVFASNTQRQLLIRIPLTENRTPETPEVFLTNINLDDFAFDINGNLYGTTHVYNSAVRISPDKEVTIIAKAEEGMTGNTAVCFGRSPEDNNCIYITTNGGISLPPATGVAPAKVVRLDVGAIGV